MPTSTLDETANLGLPHLLASQSDKHVTLNAALQRLDFLAQCRVESQRVTSEPNAPNQGRTWIVPAGASGSAWSRFAAGSLAHFCDGAWTILSPTSGLSAYVRDEARSYVFDGNAWVQAVQSNDQVNRLINGGFQIWQRGTSFASIAPNEFGPDRWRAVHSSAGGPQLNWGRTGLAPSNQLPASCFCALRMETIANGTSPLGLEQAIEDVRTLAGRWVCLSFYARASTALQISPSLEQRFGVAGSAPTMSALASVMVSVNWSRIECVVFLPSLTGKTIGPNSALALRLSYSSMINSWLEITGIKLEAGQSASLFERHDEPFELAACQRYFYSTLMGRKPAAGQGLEGALMQPRLTAGSYYHRMSLRFPIRMRAFPALTFFNPVNLGGQCTDADAGVDCTNTAPLSFGQSPDQAVIFTQTPASGTPGSMLAVHMTASAEL